MKFRRISIRYLQLGSSLICGLLLFGCESSRSEWVVSADWIYINNSSHKLEVQGFTGFSTQIDGDFNLMQGETHVLEYKGEGEKDLDPKRLNTPFTYTEQCAIVVDGRTYNIVENQSIRSQDNYIIEKLRSNHFRFIFTFTDENITEVANSNINGWFNDSPKGDIF